MCFIVNTLISQKYFMIEDLSDRKTCLSKFTYIKRINIILDLPCSFQNLSLRTSRVPIRFISISAALTTDARKIPNSDDLWYMTAQTVPFQNCHIFLPEKGQSSCSMKTISPALSLFYKLETLVSVFEHWERISTKPYFFFCS